MFFIVEYTRHLHFLSTSNIRPHAELISKDILTILACHF
jgi:hypothetical protein